MRSSNLLALAASLSTATAVFQGFNYGATKSDGVTARVQSDFQALFHQAKNLVGASGFSSARLYTTVQAGTGNDPTSAIPAAIAEDTSLLLGIWASAGQAIIDNEIIALKRAITQYGTAFTSRVAGISVGSEDLYRISPTGIAAKSGYGADPATVASYIGQVRQALVGTALSGAAIGHVDTWTAWVNGTNQAVINACDWIGVDAYPYFQNTQANSIENGAALFNDALGATQAAVGSKPVWITETGWPVTGATQNLAVPNAENAKTYWDQVGCPRFGKVNVWWYTIEDTDFNASPNPSFGIASGTPLSTTPYFDISCSNIKSPSSSSSGSGSSPTSVASNGPASSASSAPAGASGVIVSSGSPLSPTQGAGIGANGSSSASGAASTGTTLKPSGTGAVSGTSSKPATASSTNGASIISGSVMGAVGALFVAVAAL